MDSYTPFNTRSLLELVLAGTGCPHQWSKPDEPHQQWITCYRCGLYAYARKPRSGGMEKVSAEQDYAQSIL